MQNLTIEQATDYLDSALYLEPTIDTGRRAIHFGIDADGKEFVHISDGATGGNMIATF